MHSRNGDVYEIKLLLMIIMMMMVMNMIMERAALPLLSVVNGSGLDLVFIGNGTER